MAHDSKWYLFATYLALLLRQHLSQNSGFKQKSLPTKVLCIEIVGVYNLIIHSTSPKHHGEVQVLLRCHTQGLTELGQGRNKK